MKKVIRLTEKDLTNIVKRVLEEQSAPQGDGIQKMVVDCFMSTLSLKDVTKVPKSCIPIGIKIATSKKLPTFEDFPKAMQCATDLGKVIMEDPMGTFDKIKEVGECLLSKAQSPVKY